MIDQNALDRLIAIMDEFEFNHYEEFDPELQKSFQEARDVLVDTKGQDESQDSPKKFVRSPLEIMANLNPKEQDDDDR